MRKIRDIGELYGMVYQLLVEVECPMCNNICISTMVRAETILVFGCTNCTDIEQSMLTEMNIPIIEIIPKDAMVECVND